MAKVAAQDVRIEVRAPVDLQPLVQAEVGSKTLGYLDAVLVDHGDRVKRGQLLALVRPSDLPDQLAAARGALAQAQASVGLAKANYDRATQLAPSGVVSQQELQQSAAALASAEAAQAQIAALGVRLNETRIESPLDGVVVHRRFDPGAVVGPTAGGIILTVARTDVLRVFISVGERAAQGLAVGQDAHVELDALPGRSFWGKVVRVAPAFAPATHTLAAEVHLPNGAGELRPGMYGRGAIVRAVHVGAAVVPDGAVQLSGGCPSVFVVEGDRVRRRRVELGVDGGSWLDVVKGLWPGDEIVTAGADGLADGAPVRVARGASPFGGGAGRR